MIAKTLIVINSGPVTDENKTFREICQDVLTSETSRVGSISSQQKIRALVDSLIHKHCAARAT